MSTKNEVQIAVDLDSRAAERGFKKLADGARDTADGVDEVGTAGAEVAAAIEQRADEMIVEIDQTKAAIAAMAAELEDTEIDPTRTVANLKRLGLTANEIEDDAEALARSLKSAGRVEAHAAEQGFANLGDAVSDVDDRTGKAGDTMRGFGGGVASEMAGASGALGPFAEGVGQLAEGALEGEVNLKSMALAGGGMAAVSLAMKGITDAMADQAAIDAFNKEQVEEYTEALKGADTNLVGIVEKLRSAEGVSINLFGDETDITKQLVDAGLSVESFAALLDKGERTWDEWAEGARGAGVDAGTVEVVLAGLTSESNALEAAQRAAAVANAFLGDELADTEARAASQLERINELSGGINSYAEDVNTIPRSVVTELQALVEEGSLGEVERRLNELARDRVARITGSYRETGTGVTYEPTNSFMGGDTLVNVPHGYRPSDIAALQRRNVRRTGR